MFIKKDGVMNKRILFLAGLFSLSAVQFSVVAEPNKRVNKDMSVVNTQLKQFLSSYMGALAVGGAAGVAAGTGVGYLQNKLIQYLNIQSPYLKLLVMIAACNLGSEVLGNMIAGIQNHFDANQIDYQDGPMEQSALIGSVLAYFHA